MSYILGKLLHNDEDVTNRANPLLRQHDKRKERKRMQLPVLLKLLLKTIGFAEVLQFEYDFHPSTGAVRQLKLRLSFLAKVV